MFCSRKYSQGESVDGERQKGKRVNARKSCRDGTLPLQETVQPTCVVHS